LRGGLNDPRCKRGGNQGSQGFKLPFQYGNWCDLKQPGKLRFFRLRTEMSREGLISAI
jgi:hypothetical protein